ncbi:MAG: sialate O-acetylesterase [Muribaculaceae bacterium]|nr:sialate O-acetylesterase [Muribaculaceae bacterium]
MKKTLILALLCLSSPANSDARIQLPSLISDNMVVQQQSDIRLWGKASPGSEISVSPSWSSVPFKTFVDNEGRWELFVPTPAASKTPYSITFSDKDGSSTVSNVLAGEVWFCSGQSNMEMPMRGYRHQPVDGGLDVIICARDTTPIRMFTVDKAVSSEPLDSCSGHWALNTSDEVAECSATAYFFAEELRKVLGDDIPVGLIISVWGGTTVQPWMSPSAATSAGLDLSRLNEPVDRTTPDVLNIPSTLYNAMVSPVLPFTVKGMLWYQGESNCSDPGLYAQLMPEFVKCMRAGFGRDDLPFYYVQIAPHDGYGDLSDNVAPLRLAQSHLMQQLPYCGMVVTLDIGNRYCIHPTDKRTVGKRLAYWALAKDYGKNDFAFSGPIFDRMEWDGKRALLFFSNTGGGVSPLEQELNGFEAAGEDGIYHPARAIVECETGTLSVYCDEIDEIKKVRYAHSSCPTATLFDNYQLPAAPFTTCLLDYQSSQINISENE